MLLHSFRNVLLISPHTDDCEFGMGATMSRLVERGCNITWLICSNASKSLPPGWTPSSLIDEQKESARRLGIPVSNLIFWDFPVREFPAKRQELLEQFVALNRRTHFDVVFCPSEDDKHQDHMTVHQEVIRAFKSKSILGYDLPWNNLSSNLRLLIKLNKAEIDKKNHVIQSYRSQAHRHYMNKEVIESIARARGLPVGADYAEAFEVIRLVG